MTNVEHTRFAEIAEILEPPRIMFGRIEDRYRDSTVVVIGAGGIGLEISRLLANYAAKLVVADFRDTALGPIATLPGNCQKLTYPLDVRDPRAVTEFARWLAETVGPPHFLFYTAGILNVEPFLETAPEAWQRAIEINLNGAFYCTKAVAELMVPAKRGSILLLGSIAGTRARSGSRVNPVYNASKAAISGFVNGTAMQLRPHAVRINCISPGPTATPMMDVQPAAVHAAVREIGLDGRMNQPTEVAELALFVAAHGRFTGEDVGLGGGAGLGG